MGKGGGDVGSEEEEEDLRVRRRRWGWEGGWGRHGGQDGSDFRRRSHREGAGPA